jgi:cysteine desulfuration protein SufE
VTRAPPDRLLKTGFWWAHGAPELPGLFGRDAEAYICCVMTSIDDIVANFELLDEWDDRYRYVIELGRTLSPLAESGHAEANKVQGCASQVWLLTHVKPNGPSGPILTFEGDSDAHIVRGLIAILFALYSGKSARDILAVDATALFDRIGLKENLTPQRSNGLRSMVERIRAEAAAALAAVT